MNVSEEIARSSVKGGFYLFIGVTLSTGINALTSILIGRLLGPGNYGLYSLSLTPASLLLIASGFGINVALVKYLSKYDRAGRYGLIKKYIKAGLLLQVSAGIILASIIILYSPFFARYLINRPGAEYYITITSIYIIGILIFNTINQSFIGLNRMERSSILSFLQSSSKFVMAVGLVLLGFGVTGAVTGHSISYLIAGIIGSAILYIYLKNKNDRDTLDEQNDLSKVDILFKMIKFGFPVYLYSIMNSFIGVYRNFLMSIFASNIEIGNFVAAMNLSTSVTIFIGPISTVLFPAFSRLEKTSEINIIRDLFQHAVKYSSIIILPVALFIMFLSKDVTYLFYGSSYMFAPTYLMIALIQYLMVGIGSVVLISFFNGLGDTKKVFRIGLLSTLVSIVTYPVLILIYHLIGLLVAILISIVALLSYGLYLAYKEYHVSIDLKSISRIYVAGMIASIAIYSLRRYIDFHRSLYNVIFFGLLFLVIYLLTLPYVHGVSEKDLDILDDAFKGIKLIGYFMHLIFEVERKLLRRIR